MRGLNFPLPLTPENFATRCTTVAGGALQRDTPVALAVSGGADSLAMLWLAVQAFGPRAHVLTFDHGLRAESRGEAAMVAKIATSVGLGSTILSPPRPLPRTNIQAEARRARFAAMAEWCESHAVGWLLTAHHADDQAETILMRLARGAGLDGLRGIRPMRPLAPQVTLLRPLLPWCKAELVAVVERTGWPVAQDPSNSDPHYDRTHARTLLMENPWLDARRLAAAAHHIRQAGEALDWVVDQAWRSRVTTEGEGFLLDPEALPPELQRRLLLRGLAAMGEHGPRGEAVTRLLITLAAGGRATLGNVVADNPHGRWRLRPAPARKT